MLLNIKNRFKNVFSLSWFTPRRTCRALLVFGIAFYIFIFLRLTFNLFDRYAYMAFDLGIFDQAEWLISKGSCPFVTVRGVHIMGDHFSAILYLIAPIYRVFPSPKTLLALQTIALSLGAVPAYGLARKRLKSESLALLFSLLYLIHPAHQWSLTYEFHPDTFATPLLVTVFYAIETKRWRLFSISLFLVALLKESACLIIVCVGLWTYFKDRKIGLLVVCFGLAMLPVAMLTVKYFNDGIPSPYFAIFRQFGSTPIEMVHNFYAHPYHFILKLITIRNISSVGSLMLVFCFLPLFVPELILLTVPLLMINFMGWRTDMHTCEGYYFAFITPFFYLGAIKGFERLKKNGWFLRTLVLLNLPIWAFSGLIMGPFGRPIEQIYNSQPPQGALTECNHAVNSIPNNESVSTVMAIGPHLSRRPKLFLFPNPFVVRVYGGTRKALEEVIGNIDSTILPPNLPESIPNSSSNVKWVILCPKSNPYPIVDSIAIELSVLLLQSKKYETNYVGKYVMVLRRSEAPTLSLLSESSGKPVRTPKEIEAAYWHWYALQFPAPKGVAP